MFYLVMIQNGFHGDILDRLKGTRIKQVLLRAEIESVLIAEGYGEWDDEEKFQFTKKRMKLPWRGEDDERTVVVAKSRSQALSLLFKTNGRNEWGGKRL